jgi:hypothetical protein
MVAVLATLALVNDAEAMAEATKVTPIPASTLVCAVAVISADIILVIFASTVV